MQWRVSEPSVGLGNLIGKKQNHWANFLIKPNIIFYPFIDLLCLKIIFIQTSPQVHLENWEQIKLSNLHNSTSKRNYENRVNKIK